MKKSTDQDYDKSQYYNHSVDDETASDNFTFSRFHTRSDTWILCISSLKY